jgi:hypothetical protein
MRINRDQVIAGYPAIKIRDMFRAQISYHITTESISEFMTIPIKEAYALAIILHQEGFIEPIILSGKSCWQRTAKANILANASARKPIKRKTASQIVNGLLSRIQIVNSNGSYLYLVEKAIVTGDYLRDKEFVEFVGVTINLKSKFEDINERMKREEEHRMKALNANVHFRYCDDIFSWPLEEVHRFLKNRILSLYIDWNNDVDLTNQKIFTLYENKTI